MAGNNTVDIKAAADSEAAEGRRERSTISFPYGDLDNAIEVARAINNNAGVSCTVEQLAAYMGQTGTSGAFRLNLSTARIFGLTELEKGQISLTDLGRRIVDPAQEPRARTESFLKVPLYDAIYTRYKQHMLPPAAALEREMGSLGVSSKQTDKARQAFERSAQQAGFFAHGRERLVLPAFRNAAPETLKVESNPESLPPSNQYGGGGGGGKPLDPLIQGLLNRLPEPDTEWHLHDQAKWLQAVSHAFALMYKTPGTDRIQVSVINEHKPN